MPDVLDISDPAAFVWKTGIDGRPVRVLADGVNAVRVRTMLRDANTVGGQIARDRQRVVDGGGGTAGLHRPGPRFASDAGLLDAARKAYEQRVADGEERWRAGPGGGLQDASVLGTAYSGKPGDSCTVRAGAARGWIEGSPGHLVYLNIEGEQVLICVPNRPSVRPSDSAPSLDWRTTDLAKLVRDAAAIKQQAYEAACADSERAWMRLGSS